MRRTAFSFLLLALACLAGAPAWGQGASVNLWCWNSSATIGADQYKPCNSSTPLYVTGTITAASAATATAAAPSYSEGTSNALSQNLTGDLRVIAKQSTSPWIAAGGGTAGTAATGVLTVQGIASMTPVQVSQATASNLNAVVTGSGTAGSAAAGVVTVQGVASMTPVQVSQGAAATGGYSYLNIAAGQATTVVKASAGTLHSIILNSAATATNSTIVYDHASGVGTVIGRPAVTTATVPTTLLYDLAFGTGLTIITSAANGGDMTVVYK